MTPIERKLLGHTIAIGMVLTLAVTLFDLLNVLAPFERWLYDRRAGDNQRFTPSPSTELMHVSIDNAALDRIGRWPWTRAQMAKIIDDLKDAGAKVIAVDIIFPDAERIEVINQEGETDSAGSDSLLAESIERAGNVLMPVDFNILATRLPIYEEIVEVLLAGLEQPPDEVARRLVATGRLLTADADHIVQNLYGQAIREAMFRCVTRELKKNPEVELPELVSRLLPEGARKRATSWLGFEKLKRQLEKARAMGELHRFSRPEFDESEQLPPIARVIEEMPPIRAFSSVIAATAFVDYAPDPDGVVRSVPLCLNHRGRIYPQFGLALACQAMGVPFSSLRLERHRVILPRPDGDDLEIPVRIKYRSGIGQDIGLVMDIPWRGKVDDWKVMYDPLGRDKVNHTSITMVTQIQQSRRDIAVNNDTLDDAMLYILAPYEEEVARSYRDDRPPLDEPDHRRCLLLERALKLADEYIRPGLKDAEPGEFSERVQEMYQAVQHIDRLPELTARLVMQRDRQVQALREKVNGRAVIIGWAATAVAADFVPTPLHYKCPGAVIHGAVFNAIMTGDLWRRAPRWVELVVTVVVGLLATFAVAGLTPLRSLLAALAVAIAYFMINSILLFDYGDTIVGIAGPITAVGLVWSGLTLYRFIVEKRERKRVENRFRSYVDPVLVDYVIAHPEQAQLDGREDELTVVFTDLAGFTSLSEKLRRRTVGILNEYMELMVPIIRDYNGYVNKFLGDGIMFFYGAPESNQLHAMDAVRTALKMQQVMPEFNRQLADRDLPAVKMRVGISSGSMVVGDAGSRERSDYTVLGDAVNIGARLESANKATGTWILINDRAAMLVQDLFLLRPVGRLQVVGKSQGIMTFEPLCAIDEATDEQKRMVDLTNEMINAYIMGQFEDCISRSEEMEKECGESKLTQMYARLSRDFLETAPGPDFIGQVVLEEK